MKKIKFSIIIPICYSADNCLEKTISSIINQSISFDNIQLILISNGISNDLDNICLKYLELYPDNIIYKKIKNIKLADAKNEGLKYVKGELVNFSSLNIEWNINTYEKVYDSYINNSSFNIFSCDDNLCKYSNDKEINVNSEYQYSLINFNSIFIKCGLLKKYKFSYDFNYYDNVKFILDIFLDETKFILLKKSKQKYIKNIGSNSDLFKSDLNWYLSVPKNVYDYLYEKSKSKYKKVREFIQYNFLIDLKKRIVYDKEILTIDQKKIYNSLLSNLILITDDKLILENSSFSLEEKMFLLELKYNKNPIKDIKYLKDKIMYKEYKFNINDLSLLYIDQIYIRKNKIVFYGSINRNYLSKNMNFEIKYNDEPIKINYYELSKKMNFVSFNGKKIYDYIGINFEVPFNNEFWKLEFCFGNFIVIPKFTIGGIFTNSFDRSYHHANSRTLVHKSGKIYNQKRNLFKSFYYEICNIKQLISKRKLKSLLIRVFVKISRIFKIRELWFVSDRVNKADDNGEHFFKYLKKNFPNKNLYFVISSSSPDYNRMKKIGKVIDPSSLKYKFIINIADYIVSSHAENYIFNPLGRMGSYIRDQYEFKYIFLQHGITKDDLSPWLNVNAKRIDLFVTSSVAEYESMFKYNYYYGKDVIKLTGLPRFDNLIKKQSEIEVQNLIMLSFTWRNSLSVGVDYKTGNKLYNPHFKESDYFKFINKIINDKRLLKTLEEKGYKIRFIPHPNVVPQINDFDINDKYVEFEKVSINYQEEFCKAKLMVTDYSSVYFDFGYLKKPVIYYQEDREKFFEGQVYQKGYFDYDTMGFGPCYTDYDKFIDNLIKIIKNDCVLDKKYLNVINSTFKYYDTKNCERVYNEIMKLK